MNKWKYGDSWEKFPIEVNQTWEIKQNRSMVSVHDILSSFPSYMLDADLIYCDPPWNLGNANTFHTKNESGYYINSFSEFYDKFFSVIGLIDPLTCFVEIGKQNLKIFQDKMAEIFPIVKTWEITYYKKNTCYLIRGGKVPTAFNFTGLDDEEAPLLVIQNEECRCIGDLCTGRGLTALAAYQCGKRFVGTELNKRRLAVTIERVSKLGGVYENTIC
jgi:DNA modification methylase